MNIAREIDLKELCRICSVHIAEDNAPNLLIESNVITDLGEIFISCLGIQLMKDGYPERVCDFCSLQLNTFYAFVKKAKATSAQFENVLQAIEQKFEIEQDEQEDDAASKIDTLSNADAESDRSQQQDNDIDDSSERDGSVEMEFLIDNSTVAIEGSQEIEFGDYPVEYLEGEYMSNFVDEIAENENQVAGSEKTKGRTRRTATKRGTTESRAKRSYPYRCKKCGKRFVYKEVYEAHMRIHKGLPGFTCQHCGKTFNEKPNFDYHMQDHTNYRPAKCHLCEKSFKNKQDLASHIRCHNDIRKYMCDVCGKRFRSQSHMTYHRYAHFDARNFHCDQCEQKFKSPHILRTHKNTVHSNVYRYECEQCGRKFKRDHHLVAHRRTHNKPPGRKPRAQKKGQSASAQSSTMEVIEVCESDLIKEEVDIVYGDASEQYEAEYITS